MRRPHLITLLAISALAVSACGDDEEEQPAGQSEAAKPQVLDVKTSGAAKNAKLTAPATAKAGAVELRLSNEAKGDHTAQLFSLAGDATLEEGLRAGEAWGEKGKALPEWMRFAGGVGSVEPGESQSVTVELKPGRYAVVDIEGGGKDAMTELKVSGSSGAKLPSGAGRIVASEYKFEASGLKAGRNKVVFENGGSQPHHLVAAPLLPGKTVEDVKTFLQKEKGRPPIDEEKSVDSAIIDGGVKQVLDLELESGTYAMLCFVPDRQGGPPHMVKGMISEATVE